MKATLKLVKINRAEIKYPTQIVFGRNNCIYVAAVTYQWIGEVKQCSPGEYHITEINREDDRFINPDLPDRIKYDYFQKVVAEVEENGKTYQYNVQPSEWQLIVNCLLGREVEVKTCSFFTYKEPTVTVIGVYSPEVSKLEEALVKIRDISQPHWTEHEHWNTVCEIAKDTLISQQELKLKL